VTPPQAAQALAQLIPRSQLLQIKRAGHAPFISHPQEVGAALLGFTRAQARPWRSADSRVMS
jgi:pimeloyl-ACP methyl ester carboxylesterase